MTIFVLGAGPVDGIPDEVPRLVVAANEGVFHLSDSKNRFPRVWVLAPAEGFVEDAKHVLPNTHPSDNVLTEFQGLLSAKAPYERLIIRTMLNFPASVAAQTQLAQRLSPDVRLLAYGSIAQLWLKHFSFSEILSLNLRQNREREWLPKVLSMTSWKRIFSGQLLKASSGGLALLLALEEALPGESIHVLGVTASRETYGHDKYPVPNHSMHVDADLLLFKRLMKKCNGVDIRFDDKDLRRLLSGQP